MTTTLSKPEKLGRVLVVEDNRINRLLIRTILDDYNVSHETACGGQQALVMLSKQKFDLILMDIMMPGMDGIETTRHIRAMDHPNRSIPIIALTSFDQTDIVNNSPTSELDGFIAKPVDAETLIRSISEYSNHR